MEPWKCCLDKYGKFAWLQQENSSLPYEERNEIERALILTLPAATSCLAYAWHLSSLGDVNGKVYISGIEVQV